VPLAGFETLVPSCLRLEVQQQVRWLQLAPLVVHQSFQPPAEAFLVRIPLGGVALQFKVLTTGFIFGSFLFGTTSNRD
jgi:hypothetical protein